jgi:hypothetical protein
MFRNLIQGMNCKIIVVSVFVFLCVLGISGCEQEEEFGLSKLEDILFKNLETVHYSKSWHSSTEALTNTEIMELKSSIRNGTDFSDKKGSMPFFKDTNNMVFILQYKGKWIINLIYERDSGYLYFPKSGIHREEAAKHKTDIQWIEQHLSGVYRIHPGLGFEVFLK